MYKTFHSYWSALLAFGFKHPIYSFKLFKIVRRKDFEEQRYFYVRETLKIIQETVKKRKQNKIESIFNNRFLSRYYFANLYAVCRVLKPSIVVETGVGAGLSSTFILQALYDNNLGRLYSIDLPRAKYLLPSGEEHSDNFLIPQNKDSGWVIPNNLRGKWTLIEGRSNEKLPKLLDNIKNVDLFFHDSEHTYENMMWEYQTVWPYLNSKGILASHDVSWNSAFVDFAKQVNGTPIFSGGSDCGFIMLEGV